MVYCSIVTLCCFLWISLVTGQQNHGNIQEGDVTVASVSTEQAILEGDAVLDDFYVRYATTPLVDLVFVLDRSGSVPQKGWGAIVNFLYDTLQHFTVDPDNTRVAIVTFSNDVTVDINDLDLKESDNHGNKCTLHSRIEALIETKIPYGYTATHDALYAAYNILINSRPEAKKAVLVLTDGESNIGPPPVRATYDILSLEWNAEWNETAMGPQVEIYAFGIQDAFLPELNSIASPLPNHTFLIPSFEAFESFAQKLHGGKQDETWIRVMYQDCQTSCSKDHAQCMCGARRGQYACVCDPGYERIGIDCKACDKGYYKAGHSLSMCVPCPVNYTTDHTTSTRQEDCKLMPGMQDCPAIPEVENGWSFFVPGIQKDEVPPSGQPCVSVRNGNSCHYKCEEGYWMQGSPIMHCNPAGAWEGTPPNCSLIDCGDPESLYDDLVNVTLDLINGTTTYNSVIQVTCADGLVPIGQTTWTCDRHGKWTKPWNFLCAEIQCPPLPSVPFSTSMPEACSRYQQRYGTNCTVECAEGFELVGSSTVLCDFKRRALWDTQTAEWPWCKDIKAPEIICPSALDLVVMDWEQNSTHVDIQATDAPASDNSGNFTQWVTGVPEGGIFKLGVKVVTYYAQDSSGLSSRCERTINVRAKQVNVVSCPQDIIAEMNSKDGMLDVTWDDPVFRDSMDNLLPFTCFPTGPFNVGNRTIKCMDSKYQEAKCQFNVVVTMPECPVPFADQIPPNSAVICGVPSGQLYPKWCRIHCAHGYELKKMGLNSDHRFECGWDGEWRGLENGWPRCSRSRRPFKPFTIGKIHVGYEGSCEQEKRAISLGFIESVIAILTKPGRPCSGDVQCTVRDVEVHCGEGRKKRSPGAVEEASIVFTMSASMENLTEDTVTAEKQRHIAFTLDDAFIFIEDLFYEGNLQLTINNNTMNVTGIETLEGTTFIKNCSQIKEESSDTYFGCISCPAGSYFVNDSCVDCPAGTYQPISGAFDCELCPEGTTSITGAVSKCQCVHHIELTTESPQNASSPKTLKYTESNPCNLCHAQSDNCTDEVFCEPYCYHGTCSEDKEWVSCDCEPNYTGARCDVLIDACFDVQCFDGATCVTCDDCMKGYTCLCEEGFAGEFCEATKQQCDEDTCLHGYCIDHHDNHSCVCDDGWVGARCDQMLTECDAKLCRHGDCSLYYGHTMCHCHAGYTGESCEYLDDPCGYVNCSNDGVCVNTDGIAKCLCEPGFTGELCETEVCLNHTCENNSTCLVVGALPVCKCQPGYYGTHCDNEATTDFDLVFRTGHTDDFVSLRVMDRELYNLTACVWLRTQDVLHYGTVFSYAAHSNWINAEDVDVFTLHNYGKLEVIVNGESVETDVVLNDGAWHHLCFTWNQVQGQWAVYVNGTVKDSGSRLAEDTYIEPGGYFVIGQNQETIGDGFSQRDTFTGEMHQLNIYSHQMSAEDIYSLYNLKCQQPAGDVIAWTHVIGHVTGDVEVRRSSWCLDVNECMSPHSCSDNELCTDELSGSSCVTDPCDVVECLHDGVCQSDVVSGILRTQCHCQRGYTGETCEVKIPPKANCHVSPCLHGGTCTDHGDCFCTQGYTGKLCEIFTDPCLSQPCANGGSCLSTPTAYNCTCLKPWTGNTCQTRFGGSGCEINPCLNDGECEEQPDTEKGYVCKCHNENAGDNCESNVCLNKPCHNGGTCVSIDSTSFECLCPVGFSGSYCDLVSSTPKTTVAPTLQDICHGVICKNGGVCISNSNGFKCKCTLKYFGPYCGKSRTVYEHVYDIQVVLDVEYTPDLEKNNTFKEQFVNTIHKLYQPELKDSTIQVVIKKISKGSVILDFQIIHTNYSQAESPTADMMEKILTKQLMTGKLGPWKTDVDKYEFEAHTSTKVASPTIWLTCVIVVLVVILALIVGCICYRKRRLSNAKPMRMNNFPERVQFRIRNDTLASGKSPPSPTVQIRMGSCSESVYAEPYSVSPSSQPNEVGPKFPSKRGQDINHTWGSRQSVPLPPPPSEEKTPFPSSRGHTPPPPYSKFMKVDNANINPAETSKCSEKEVLYITPLAEEDIAATKADIDQQYLTPRVPPRQPPRPLNKEEIDNLENEAIYLHPRTDGTDEEEECVEEKEEDAYLMPQSIKPSEELIPSDHESEDERVAEHTRVYANEAVSDAVQ